MDMGQRKEGERASAWHCDVNSFSVGWERDKEMEREVGPRAVPVVGGRVMEVDRCRKQ